MRLLVRGGYVVDPESGLDGCFDVLVENGIISAVERDLTAAGESADRTIDATGKVVVPGLIDMHVHLRDPGEEHKEDIETGTRAAAMGGVTTVACMPNTDPVVDDRETVAYVVRKAAAVGITNVYPIGSLTKGLGGEALSDMGEMAEEGAVAFSDDGRTVMDAGVMRRAMTYARMLGRPVFDHCLDDRLAAGGVMHEGRVSLELGLTGIPSAAEDVVIARDVLLSELTDCPVHICHVSTESGVRLIREAKRRGVNITAEACPHHFTLTDEAVEGYDTATKVSPPLRTAGDVEAVKEGLRDGTIDCIVTDHAPHSREEKELEYDRAPFGMVGLETSFPIVYTHLVSTGVLTLREAVAKMTCSQAKILGLDRGRLRVGAPGDLAIIDTETERAVDPAEFASRARNTPFAGWRLKGWPVATVVAGRVVMEGRSLVG